MGGPARNFQTGARGLLPPPRYATVPGLRKGNASKCKKRASPMGAPPQPLRGARIEGGGRRLPPPSYATDKYWMLSDVKSE